jgi:uncharacterized protein (DUF1778 family)
MADNNGDTKSSSQLNIRVRPGQIAFWEEAAKVRGLTLAAWLKSVASAAAAAVLAEVDEKHGSHAKK